MEKDVLLYFWTRIVLLLTVISVILVGCATNARNLPLDYNSVDAQKRLSISDFDTASIKLTCSQIDEELKLLESNYALQVQDITEKRRQNQVAGYLGGVFFLPALLATDNSNEAKLKIDNINKAKDLLYKLRVVKKCSSNF